MIGIRFRPVLATRGLISQFGKLLVYLTAEEAQRLSWGACAQGSVRQANFKRTSSQCAGAGADKPGRLGWIPERGDPQVPQRAERLHVSTRATWPIERQNRAQPTGREINCGPHQEVLHRS